MSCLILVIILGKKGFVSFNLILSSNSLLFDKKRKEN